MVKIRVPFLLAVMMFVLWVDARSAVSAAAGNSFPVYDAMRANVAFWKTVYAKYPTSNGLIHDNRDLSIIYEVIDLEPRDRSGADKRNTARVDGAKAKYKKILLSLAAGGIARTSEEKRVRALFGAKPSSSRLRAAADAVRFQLCLKDHFAEGVVRSGAYLDEIKKIFRSYGLPEELAYLPHVESSFNYKAYSKSGAAGIWQFTRDTGKRFMTIDYTLDERRDPIRATHAAARFLKGNYERLGSWPLALTAYNHGTTGMVRAKNAMGNYENIFRKYEGSRFGFASRNFYSEFIAAVDVAKNYKKHFGNIKLDDPVSHYEVALSNYAPVKDLSRHFKVDLATLRELNPALRPPVFEGRKHVPKGYRLRLPGKKGPAVQVASAVPRDILVDQQKPSRFYRVRKGDTVGTVARRHGVKMEDLVAANDLDSRKMIVVGQNLRIPSREEKIVPLAKTAATGGPAELAARPLKIAMKGAKEQPRQNANQAAPAAAAPAELTAGPLKVALKGAKAEGPPAVTASVPAESVITPQTARQMADDEFPIIQASAVKKVISASKRVAKTEEDGAANVGSDPARETVLVEETRQLERQATLALLPQGDLDSVAVNPRVVTGNLEVEVGSRKNGRAMTGTIKVEAGETIGHYAGWLKVPTGKILRANGLRSASSIKLGQQLKISFDKVAVEEFEQNRYEYHKEIEEDFFAVYKIEGARLYRIKAGDNIWKLCADEFDLPAWLVRKYNTAHDFNNLKLDDQLVIPVVSKVEEG